MQEVYFGKAAGVKPLARGSGRAGILRDASTSDCHLIWLLEPRLAARIETRLLGAVKKCVRWLTDTWCEVN